MCMFYAVCLFEMEIYSCIYIIIQNTQKKIDFGWHQQISWCASPAHKPYCPSLSCMHTKNDVGLVVVGYVYQMYIIICLSCYTW